MRFRALCDPGHYLNDERGRFADIEADIELGTSADTSGHWAADVVSDAIGLLSIQPDLLPKKYPQLGPDAYEPPFKIKAVCDQSLLAYAAALPVDAEGTVVPDQWHLTILALATLPISEPRSDWYGPETCLDLLDTTQHVIMPITLVSLRRQFPSGL